MGRFLLAGFVLAQIFLFQAMAVRSDGSEPNPLVVVAPVGGEPHAVVGGHHATADPPSGSGAELSSEGEAESSVVEPPVIRRLGKHHSSDKSVAGGGVIIGGLVTAAFAAVYGYIRVTRRRDGEKY